jgi:hypothetical protein
MGRPDTSRRIALIAGVAALLAGAGITAADAAGGHSVNIQTVSIGNCTTEGAFVSCSVQGDIAHPRSISVQVWATPAQQINVTWGDLCVNGFTSGDRSGSFTVTAGAIHKATRGIPLSQGARGMCTPDVLVSPNGTGRIHVLLFGSN